MPLPLLILAAGCSRRYGDSDKRLVEMPKGGRLLPALVRRAGKAGLSSFVVLSAARDVDNPDLNALAAERLYSPRAEGGMGYSLADGIARLLAHFGAEPADCLVADNPKQLPAAVLLMPADLPLLRISSIRKVAEQAAERAIVVPRCAGRQGHPVAFGRHFWPALTQLRGDVGAKKLIAAQSLPPHYVDVDDPGIFSDADTSDRMRELFGRLSPP